MKNSIIAALVSALSVICMSGCGESAGMMFENVGDSISYRLDSTAGSASPTLSIKIDMQFAKTDTEDELAKKAAETINTNIENEVFSMSGMPEEVVDSFIKSSTELYALLSNLAGIPINQGIATTGSVNQKGEIQAIGGVNEKIEGYFEICKLKGLTGSQGVIIPKQNIQNLNLDDEVVNAVKNGKFHIYAVSNIDEGLEILTGVPAGKKDVPGTVNAMVYNTLKKYAKASKEE